MAKPFEVGKTYKNGYGQEVRIVAVDMKNERSVVGLALSNGVELIRAYFPNGRSNRCAHILDLIPEKDVRKAYLVVWETSGVIYTVCSQKHEAEWLVKNNSTLIIKEVEYEM